MYLSPICLEPKRNHCCYPTLFSGLEACRKAMEPGKFSRFGPEVVSTETVAEEWGGGGGVKKCVARGVKIR